MISLDNAEVLLKGNTLSAVIFGKQRFNQRCGHNRLTVKIMFLATVFQSTYHLSITLCRLCFVQYKNTFGITLVPPLLLLHGGIQGLCNVQFQMCVYY